MRDIKTREGFKYWDKICAVKLYGFIHSPDNSRVLKAEGLGNWIDKYEAQSIVDAAEEDLNEAQSQLAALREELTGAAILLKHWSDNYTKLQQRLADAERRNVDQLTLLHMAKELLSTISLHRTMAPVDWCDSFKNEVADRLEKLRSALNPNPEAASHDE